MHPIGYIITAALVAGGSKASIPRNELVNESLAWIGKYFGPVKKSDE